MRQNAHISRLGKACVKRYAVRGSVAQADVGITITNVVARVALRVDADN